MSACATPCGTCPTGLCQRSYGAPAAGPSAATTARKLDPGRLLRRLDLRRVLTVALFAAVVLTSVGVWVTFGMLAGALALLAPVALWYAALAKAEAAAEQLRRMDEAQARHRAPLARPEIPTRPTLDEGGAVAPPPWRPAASGGA